MKTRSQSNPITLSPYTRVIALDSETRILFNTRTESLVLVNKDVVSALSVVDMHGITNAELAVLYREGHLVSVNNTEHSKFWRHYDAKCLSKQVVSSTILVTTECTLSCPYCFQRKLKAHVHMTQQVASDVSQKLLARAAQIDAKHIEITFSGGEPLMNIEAINTIVSVLHKSFSEETGKSCAFGLITNGTIHDVRFMQHLLDCGLTSVQVTLDGPKAVQNTRRPAKNSSCTYSAVIDFITDCPVPLVINTVVDEDNAETLNEIVTVLAHIESRYPLKLSLTPRIGVPSVVAPLAQKERQFVSERISEALEYAATLGIRPAKPGLPAPCLVDRKNAVVFAPDGTLHVCNNTIGTDHLKDRETTVSPWTAWRRTFSERCFTCNIAPFCYGGCRFDGIARFGVFSDIVCDFPQLGHLVDGYAKALALFARSNNHAQN